MIQPNIEPELMKVSEVARMFGVTPYTIRQWIKDEKVHGVKIGKGHYWRITTKSVKQLAQDLYGEK